MLIGDNACERLKGREQDWAGKPPDYDANPTHVKGWGKEGDLDRIALDCETGVTKP